MYAELCRLLPPPIRPVERGSDAGWRELEARLGFRVPNDYRWFVSTYGTGCINDILWVCSPFSAEPSKNLIARGLKRQHSIGMHAREELYAVAPMDPYPIGYSETGGDVCWNRDGDPEAWTIITMSHRPPEVSMFSLNFCEFLLAALSRRISPVGLPNDFADHPSFVSIEDFL